MRKMPSPLAQMGLVVFQTPQEYNDPSLEHSHCGTLAWLFNLTFTDKVKCRAIITGVSLAKTLSFASVLNTHTHTLIQLTRPHTHTR